MPTDRGSRAEQEFAPHGKEVEPIFDAPPISIARLTDIASSEVWFSAS